MDLGGAINVAEHWPRSRPLLRGKPVLDATNPYRWRDGEAADLAEWQGADLFQPSIPLFRQMMSAERLRSRLDEQR
ncbi:hypothetical protein [Azorhizophilus paspali]|uniref:Uncharacterized protein n=1 Tax=Azorhizophilus paspali TaxID=69963 RepID=A0ABV6SKE4_AZOPA